ncbi:MAG: thioredoxin family protein [Bythopirellula sp.]
MGKLIARLTQLGAAAVVLSQVSVLADDTPPAESKVEPVVSATTATPIEPIAEIPIAKPRALFQHATYPEAWRAAQKSNRPILVFVSMPNCHYCVKMTDKVYQRPHVKELVSGSFETIKAGRYTHAKLVEKLHIKWYPTTVLVGPNNKVLDVIEGYADEHRFQQRLQTGLATLNSTTRVAQTR